MGCCSSKQPEFRPTISYPLESFPRDPPYSPPTTITTPPSAYSSPGSQYPMMFGSPPRHTFHQYQLSPTTQPGPMWAYGIPQSVVDAHSANWSPEIKRMHGLE